MNVYTTQDIVDLIIEEFPSYDISQRIPTVEKFIRTALWSVQGVRDKGIYTGVEVPILNGFGTLPDNLDRLLNAYVLKGKQYFKLNYKHTSNTIQIFQQGECPPFTALINYYGNKGNCIAYNDNQRDYAIYYSVERLMRDDLLRQAIDVNSYQMVVANRDKSRRAADDYIVSLDEIDDAIMAKKFGKFYNDTKHARFTFG